MPCSGRPDDLKVPFINLPVQDGLESRFFACCVVPDDRHICRYVLSDKIFRHVDLEEAFLGLGESTLELSHMLPYPAVPLVGFSSLTRDLDFEHIDDTAQQNPL